MDIYGMSEFIQTAINEVVNEWFQFALGFINPTHFKVSYEINDGNFSFTNPSVFQGHSEFNKVEDK